MKILSIRQPWSWAICNAGKDIENRDWWTGYRGPVLIHAGVKVEHDDYDFVSKVAGVPVPDVVPVGGVVGIAKIVDCVTRSDSPWFFGRYGFVLADARPLPFQKLKGRLGLFVATPDLLAALDLSAPGWRRLN